MVNLVQPQEEKRTRLKKRKLIILISPRGKVCYAEPHRATTSRGLLD